ncbi:hypothetical protein OSTOST_23197 [Ostertagia ostertagi]
MFSFLVWVVGNVLHVAKRREELREGRVEDFQHGRPLVVKPRRRRLQISRALTNPAVNLARTPTSKHCLMKASRIAPTELLRMRKSENYR